MENRLKVFVDLQGVQQSALEFMQKADAEAMKRLLLREIELTSLLENQKEELQPFLDGWKALPAQEREEHLKGRAGNLLDELESVARNIQAQHEKWFSEKPMESQPPQADIMGRISWYRSQQ